MAGIPCPLWTRQPELEESLGLPVLAYTELLRRLL